MFLLGLLTTVDLRLQHGKITKKVGLCDLCGRRAHATNALRFGLQFRQQIWDIPKIRAFANRQWKGMESLGKPQRFLSIEQKTIHQQLSKSRGMLLWLKASGIKGIQRTLGSRRLVSRRFHVMSRSYVWSGACSSHFTTILQTFYSRNQFLVESSNAATIG